LDTQRWWLQGVFYGVAMPASNIAFNIACGSSAVAADIPSDTLQLRDHQARLVAPAQQQQQQQQQCSQTQPPRQVSCRPAEGR